MTRNGIAERGTRSFPLSQPLSRLRERGARSSILDPQSSKGFTLVEMIMVIVITGIIGGIVAVFLRAPIQQYMDVSRRADMTDIADTALRRVTRDLRLALPNSVRVTGACGGAGTTCFIEFLPTTGGGRYRAGAGGGAGCPASPSGEELDFTVADDCFGVLSAMPPAFTGGESIVVYNLGIAGASAYDNSSRTTTPVAAAGNIITIGAPGKLFPFGSPSARFQVITTPVTYACAPTANGVGGTLMRWQGYVIQAAQPVALPGGGAAFLLANNVSDCRFTYDPLVSARNGLVTMRLAITRDGETVTLYNATHVSNEP